MNVDLKFFGNLIRATKYNGEIDGSLHEKAQSVKYLSKELLDCLNIKTTQDGHNIQDELKKLKEKGQKLSNIKSILNVCVPDTPFGF